MDMKWASMVQPLCFCMLCFLFATPNHVVEGISRGTSMLWGVGGINLAASWNPFAYYPPPEVGPVEIEPVKGVSAGA